MFYEDIDQEYTKLGLISPFNEAPERIQRTTTATNSIGLDTSEIDAYRQGVSLTSDTFFGKGLIKTYSGEKSHKKYKSEYGFGTTSIRASQYYGDSDYFDPLDFIQTQNISYPIITSDFDQSENFDLNGVIEPLSIKSVLSFYSIDSPYEIHDTRGFFGSGNENVIFGGCQVTNVVDYTDPQEATAYLDAVDIFNARPTNGYFIYPDNDVAPYDDSAITNGIKLSEYFGSDFIAALLDLSPHTNSYLSSKQLSQNAGFTYTNSDQLGTDSIAFGDLTYHFEQLVISTPPLLA